MKYIISESLMFQDIHYGEKFSREFIDCYGDPSTAEGLMNLHNNEAGRRVSTITFIVTSPIGFEMDF